MSSQYAGFLDAHKFLCLQYPPMPHAGDFLPIYENCRTHKDAQDVYKSLILENNPMTTETLQALQESLRLVHVRIVEVREESQNPKPVRRQSSDDTLHTPSVRNWALRMGYPLNRGRINKTIKQAYREAMGLVATEAPDGSQIAQEPLESNSPPSDSPKKPDISDVRRWAVANGIPVGARGRVKPEVLAAYQEAHGG